jgi:hypothetical protein
VGSTAEHLPKEFQTIDVTALLVPEQQILRLVMREVEPAMLDVPGKRGSLPVLGDWLLSKAPDLPGLSRSAWAISAQLRAVKHTARLGVAKPQRVGKGCGSRSEGTTWELCRELHRNCLATAQKSR